MQSIMHEKAARMAASFENVRYLAFANLGHVYHRMTRRTNGWGARPRFVPVHLLASGL